MLKERTSMLTVILMLPTSEMVYTPLSQESMVLKLLLMAREWK